MPEYITFRGNLLDHAFNGVIAHGCNSIGKFGAGFALALSKKYPQARQAYMDSFSHKIFKKLELGSMTYCTVSDTLCVVNLVTQTGYGRSKRRYVDYPAVAKAFTRLGQWMSTSSYMEKIDKIIHIPKIGTGLGGGDWTIIKRLIEESLSPFPLIEKVVIYEL